MLMELRVAESGINGLVKYGLSRRDRPAERGSASAGGASLASNFDGMAAWSRFASVALSPPASSGSAASSTAIALAPAAASLIPYGVKWVRSKKTYFSALYILLAGGINSLIASQTEDWTMVGLARGERLQIMLTDEELVALDDWRFDKRMPSRASAVRELLKRGLAAEGVALGGRLRSQDFGILEPAEQKAPVQPPRKHK
jgi:hypothetical protein